MNRHLDRASKANGRKLMRLGWSPFEPGPSPIGLVDRAEECWRNNRYIVFRCVAERTEWGPVERLMVRRNDGGTGVPWADMQRIKDELCGPERVAVEVFPPRSELVDNRNIYHLWVLPEGFELPFGLEVGS